MRKTIKIASTALLGVMLSATNINAQTVSDFENLIIPAGAFWNGSDMSGTHNNGQFFNNFTSGNAIFPNVFDTTWGLPGFWSTGFAYSNVQDSITSGFGNLYASRTGIGVNNSSNYVVAQNNALIRLSGVAQNNTVSGVFITNSTYAANSMRDGDSFAKQFGGSTGNDPDWFLLTIKGYTNGNLTADSVDFYLADYRFVDNNLDYIVTLWQWVDLTSLGAIDSLVFMLNSSDVGSFGMNTPAFFCMDNFNDQTVTVKEIAQNNSFSFYPNPAKDHVTIDSENTIDELTIIDVTGKIVYTQQHLTNRTNSIDVSTLKNGVYFIRLKSNTKITTSRLIKTN